MQQLPQPHLTVGARYPEQRILKSTLWMSPEPADIKELRKSAGLTQQQDADLIFSKLRTWEDWEAGNTSMHPGLWVLFQLKIRSEVKFRK